MDGPDLDSPNGRPAEQPWASCVLTDLLITYAEAEAGARFEMDYPALFRAVDGLDVPANPRRFLTDVGNWVPLPILRELLIHCEQMTGQKDVAYRAARAYFGPDRRANLSLFGVLFRVLNDIRSVLISSSLWAVVHTNYLKLQSFETPGPGGGLYMLAQFGDTVPATLGSLQLIRGYAEGFPRLFPFIGEVRCVEEFSQLRLEDLVREFPDFSLSFSGERAAIRHRASGRLIAEAARIPFRTEMVGLSDDFVAGMPNAMVIPPNHGQIELLTREEETDPARRPHAAWGYRIVRPGILAAAGLSHPLEQDQIFNAPYSRFHILWTEGEKPAAESSVEAVRQELSRLLFEHLRQTRRTQMRLVQQSVEKRSLTLENIRLRREIEREHGLTGIIGQSPKMQELYGVVRALAATDVSTLIYGETGTGKELIARAIHYTSPRRARRFVAVNCGALAETLLESELFGHEKGAFTGAIARRLGVFEIADGGTLFLDEIGEISPGTQVRLLRVLQEGEFQRVGGTTPITVDVRILSATNQNLEELVRSGRFRQDLYYRLNVFPLEVPPLRERTEDIPLLVAHLIERGNQRLHRSIRGVSPDVMAPLLAYAWPGNVRELENIIQRMMVVARQDTLEWDDLPPEIRGTAPASRGASRALKELARGSAEVAERSAICDALARHGGNVTQTAKALGISRATLQNKMKQYALRPPAR
jgi:DNA-binding NtrC family response regulator